MDSDELENILEQHQNWGSPVTKYVLYYQLSCEQNTQEDFYDIEDVLEFYRELETNEDIRWFNLVQETTVNIANFDF